VDLFEPDQLRPAASLNRRRFLVPEGTDPALVGRTAYDVLSTRALVAAIAGRAEQLGALQGGSTAAAPFALGAALHATDDAVRSAAEAVVTEYGRRLGYLLASLHTGNTVSGDPWVDSATNNGLWHGPGAGGPGARS
jgi:hypothetical protein